MNIRGLSVAVVVGCLSSGCLVQSLENYFIDAKVVELPGIEGSWEMVRDFNHLIGTNESVHPWYIDPVVNTQTPIYRVTSYEPNSDRTGMLSVAFFDAGGRTFCDITAVVDGRYNKYWSASNERVHTLGLVAMTNDTFRVQLLNRSWFQKAATNGTFTMSWISHQNSFLVTQSKPDWTKFLETHRSDQELFSTNKVFEFRRAKAKPTTAP
jgi:hypothetical protein